MPYQLPKSLPYLRTGSLCFALLISAACIARAATESPSLPSVVVIESGNKLYRIRYGERLRVDSAPRDSFAADHPNAIAFTPTDEFPLALNGRHVDSVVAAPWGNSYVILAIRLHDVKRSRYVYCWGAIVDGHWWAGEIGLTTPDDESPYDAVDVGRDLRGGDTIAMHWARDHVKQNGSGPGEDLLYVNSCPGNSNLGLRDAAQKLYRVHHEHERLEELDLATKR